MQGLNMPIHPKELCISFLRNKLQKRRLRLHPNHIGTVTYPPGHFYSPLLDLEILGPDDSNLPFDGEEWWEHIDLRPDGQRDYYANLLNEFPILPFPRETGAGFRYFTENNWFPASDAFTLSGIIRKERPRRIIEVGSGFSSAVMLDTLDHTQTSADLTFIEPNPERLYSLLSTSDISVPTVLVQRVQEVPLSVFDQLEARDVLFIDSSHVSKIGSDVTFILLRILPRLKPGVLIHFHDIFYPFSYPANWIREGRAWNESIFLRAFLMGNPQFEIIAFNSYAGQAFPGIFKDRYPEFLKNTGASLWIRKAG